MSLFLQDENGKWKMEIYDSAREGICKKQLIHKHLRRTIQHRKTAETPITRFRWIRKKLI
jgi:hypothetical protein